MSLYYDIYKSLYKQSVYMHKIIFERICDSMGINISSAINSFVKATIRENGLPFALKASEDPYIYSEENMKYLRKSIHQIETGKCQIHELKEAD